MWFSLYRNLYDTFRGFPKKLRTHGELHYFELSYNKEALEDLIYISLNLL